LPGFSLPEGWQILREEGAGILQAPACLDAFRDQARLCGAELRFQQRAGTWRQRAGGVVVDIEDQQVSAAKIVLALGPWACDRAAGLNLPLIPRRIPVVYYNTARPEAYRADDFPVYFWATPEDVFAGKPHIDGLGTMLVRHDDGDTDPVGTVRRVVTEEDIATLSNFAGRYVPGLNGGIRSAHICLYTMTPDNHFILDRHPNFNDIILATGFSSHGFKFAPVVGEILADLALDGRTDYPVGFWSAARFA